MLYPVDKIKENEWNPNSMADPEYQAMLEDMKAGGPDAIDPIKITPEKNINPYAKDGICVVLDGAHRYRGAVQLKWPEIRVDIVEKVDQTQARLITYKKNQERGTLDPYLEAEYFRWFIAQGKTQQEIADAHRVDRTTVAKRLSLLKLDKRVRKELTKVPHVTVSHLEPIATLTPDQQRGLVENLLKPHNYEEDRTVEAITNRVKEIKREAKLADELRKAVSKSKTPKCPACGGDPEYDYKGLPWVKCSAYNGWQGIDKHRWNLKTGKTEAQMNTAARAEDQLKHPTQKKPEFPNFVRTTRTHEEYLQAFTNFALAKIPDFTLIENLRIDGITKDGKRSRITIDDGYQRCSIDMRIGMPKIDRWGTPKEKLDLSVEAKEYKTEDLKDFKTSVSAGYEGIKNKRQAAALEKEIEDLFRKYGVKPKKTRRAKQ